jgi:hypothetical protein
MLMTAGDHAMEAARIVRDVLAEMLSLDVSPTRDLPAAPGADGILSAAVYFAGPWKGGAILECPAHQAEDFARRLLPQGIQLNRDDVRDSLGEIVNMIGGNFKAVLPDGAARPGLSGCSLWKRSSDNRIDREVGQTEWIGLRRDNSSRPATRMSDAHRRAARWGPATWISQPSGKSPSGRIPMTSSVFRLITRPRSPAGTRPCNNAAVITEVAAWPSPATMSSRATSHSGRMPGYKASAAAEANSPARYVTLLEPRSPR